MHLVTSVLSNLDKDKTAVITVISSCHLMVLILEGCLNIALRALALHDSVVVLIFRSFDSH